MGALWCPVSSVSHAYSGKKSLTYTETSFVALRATRMPVFSLVYSCHALLFPVVERCGVLSERACAAVLQSMGSSSTMTFCLERMLWLLVTF